MNNRLLTLVILLTVLLIFLSCSSNPTNNSNITPTSNPDNQMILRLSSDHFNFYCVSNDSVVLDTISILLENAYSSFENRLNYIINDTIDVYIYPDIETFHHNAQWPPGYEMPDWFVGQCVEKDIIKFVSPLSPGPVHSYESILEASVHEFGHAVNFQIVKTRARIPVWLFEGFASFASGFPMPDLNIISQNINENNIPSLFDLDSDLIGENLYPFTYTIIEYIVNEYGYSSLYLFLRNHTRYEEAFGVGITKEILEAGWHQFLITYYK